MEELPLNDPTTKTEFVEDGNLEVCLKRSVSYKHAFAFVVGSIVGAGIFVTPSLIAKHTPNLFVALLAWLFAGAVALLGSLCYCEMTSVAKKTGGSYIFVLDCYGEAAGFLVNWTNAIVFAPCDAYILLLTIGSYACAPFFVDHASSEYIFASKLVGLLVMLMVAFISSLGAKKSGVVQLVFLLVQILVIITIVCLGVYSAYTSYTISNLSPRVTFNGTLSALQHDLPSFSIAMFNALYCFDGYAAVAYVVEEVKNPTKTIPLIAFTAIPFVTLVYLLINLASAAALTHYELSLSELFIYEIANKVGGKALGHVVPFAVAACVVPALAALFYNVPRLIMSSSREGQFPCFFSLIHKDRRTPIPAIIFLFVFASILTFVDLSLETMLQVCNITIWFEYGFAISTILVNRWKRPNAKRIYRTWITTPVFMILVPLVLLGLAIVEKPLPTCMILLVMALGLPLYYLWSVLKKKGHCTCIPFAKIHSLLLKHFPLVACGTGNTET